MKICKLRRKMFYKIGLQAEIAKGFLFATGHGGVAAGQPHQPELPGAPGSAPFTGDVFKFDSFDRDRYLTRETRSCDDQVRTGAMTFRQMSVPE